MKPCIKCVHIASELKALITQKDLGSISPQDFWRQFGNIEEKIDALFQMECEHVKEIEHVG